MLVKVSASCRHTLWLSKITKHDWVQICLAQPTRRIRGCLWPAGPLLDDAEKDRLAEWMRYKGKPPERKPIVQQQARVVRKGSNAELQSLFDQIVVEVNERQSFLEDLASLTCTNGKAYQTQSNQIKREIAERVQEMKRIDQMLHRS